MPTPHPLIGLIGKKRAGKDTFAATLVNDCGWGRVALADPLKEAALSLNPIVGRPPLPGDLAPYGDVRLRDVVEALGWERAKDLAPEVRGVLQRLGTEAIRGLDPDFWLRIASARIRELRAARPVVVTDVRYPNEAETITADGGVLVRIVRPGPQAGDPHPSETALDSWPVDFKVGNTGTLESLIAVARRVADRVS